MRPCWFLAGESWMHRGDDAPWCPYPSRPVQDAIAPGAGGRVEFYRAKGALLKRDVAVEVSEQPAEDHEALGRFERGARAVATLSHLNNLAIQGVGTEGDTSYVVMQLVDGETLRMRARRSAFSRRAER